MKIVKLLIAFLVVTGGIFLAINWNSIFKSTSVEEEFAKEDKLDISKECDKIRTAFDNCKEWDKKVYQFHRSDINQSKSMGLFSREGYNTVNNCLRENAINKACNGYLNALGNRSSFNHSKVKASYQGVKELKDLEQLNNAEPRIKKVEDLHAFYTKVKNFVESSHSIVPKFDTEKADWTSFATQKQRILNTGKSYSGNSLFKEVEHIPGFKSGLVTSHLEQVTNAQRRGFHQNLSAQIIAYFEAEEPTEDRVKLLNQIYKNFVYQEEEYGVSELATLVVSYKVPEKEEVND